MPVLVCLTFADKFYAEYMSEDGQYPTNAEMEFHLQDQLTVSVDLTCAWYPYKLKLVYCRRPGRSLAPVLLTWSSSSPSLRTGTLSSTHPMADGGWRRSALAAPGTWGRGWFGCSERTLVRRASLTDWSPSQPLCTQTRTGLHD